MLKRILLGVGVVALPALGGGVAAQTVLVTALDAETSTPVFGALTYLSGPQGATVRNTLTDERGRALFVGMPPGRYRVRVEMIGLATAETDLFTVAADETVVRELRMAASAIELEDISVEAEGDRCRVRAERGMEVAEVWEEARKALAAAAFTDDEQVYRYRTVLYERDLDRDTRAVEREERSASGGYLRTPFESRPAEDLVENGFVQGSEDGGDLYFAPDADVLLSDPFLDTHCFRLQRGSGETAALVGLAFEPVADRRRIPDIAGTLWLDRSSAELQWLEFAYRNLDPGITTPDVGGRVEFRRLPNGTWIIPRWRIRMPMAGAVRDFRGQQQLVVNGYREVGGIVQQVQEGGGRTLLEAETGTIEGIVLDSLGSQPVRGARVGVVGSPQRVFTDGEGRFRITGLAGGVYDVAYTHPSLEEVGFQPETVTTEVTEGDVAAVRIVLPAVGSGLALACGPDESHDGGGILTGTVRRSGTGRALPGAVVRVEWVRYTGMPGRIPTDADVSGFETSADADGRYRVCGLPENQRLTVVGVHEGVEAAGDTVRIRLLDGVVVRDIEIPGRR